VDRLEWNFIYEALKRKNFNDDFISLIMLAFVLLNSQFLSMMNLLTSSPLKGESDRAVLSPPLFFVIAINELSLRFQEALRASRLQGITLGPGCPQIHSLLFADDLILCGNATIQEAQAMKDILNDFCSRSGQSPNLNKYLSCLAKMFLIKPNSKSNLSFQYVTFNLILCILVIHSSLATRTRIKHMSSFTTSIWLNLALLNLTNLTTQAGSNTSKLFFLPSLFITCLLFYFLILLLERLIQS
jgi:hypothetical protein